MFDAKDGVLFIAAAAVAAVPGSVAREKTTKLASRRPAREISIAIWKVFKHQRSGVEVWGARGAGEVTMENTTKLFKKPARERSIAI